MTPGQARGTLLCFALVLAGVACNAVYLQEPRGEVHAGEGGRQTARAPQRAAPTAGAKTERGVKGGARSSEADGETPTLRIARFAADTAAARPGAAVPADADTVRAIQRELAARGFGPLAQDGSPGLTTRAAIMAYEHDHGLPLTAAPSEPLLKRLLLPSDESQGRTDSAVVSAEAEQVVAAVQRSLAELGYSPGRTDGRLAAETVRAITEFEIDRGQVPKGRISAELIRQLGAAGAPPRG
jgi:peptidoglycan hydrolase-like protein with peptidoglycan-binding domain